MNDVDEKLHSQRKESEAWNLDDTTLESDNENGAAAAAAAATGFNLGFVDSEERALIDMLETEGRSSIDNVLSKDYLGFPAFTNASRLSRVPSTRIQAQTTNRTNAEFLRAFFDDESIASNPEEAGASFGDIAEDKDKPAVVKEENSALENLKKAVAGWLMTRLFIVSCDVVVLD